MVIGALAVVARDDPSPIARARGLAADHDAFRTGTDASVTLARMSGIFEHAGLRCQAEHAADDTRCLALLSAAGWTRVSAVRALGCTAPGRADLERSLAGYLDRLGKVRENDPEVPEPPPMPDCPIPQPG